MTNIPTDLLRTLIAVVDLRSFTKAAAKLGITQPAVSAQIKRLQFLLGGELFDRSVQGISLTTQGEIVVTYARRLLAINDQIVHIGSHGARSELAIRIGTPSEYIAALLPGIFARFRERWPDVRFAVSRDFFDPLMRQLHDGTIDVMIGLSMAPPRDARHSLAQEVVWVRGATTHLDPEQPVPLVSYGESCVYHQLAVHALQVAGLEWEDTFTGPSVTSLSSAIAAGLGVMAITRRRANRAGMMIWEGAPLPKLPDLYSGIYVREGGAHAIYGQLADDIAAVFYDMPQSETPSLGDAAAARKADTAA